MTADPGYFIENSAGLRASTKNAPGSSKVPLVKVKFRLPTRVYGPAGPPVILRIEMCSWPSLAEVRKTRLPAACTAVSTPAGSV